MKNAQHRYDISGPEKLVRTTSVLGDPIALSLTVNSQKKFYSTGINVSNNKHFYTYLFKNKVHIKKDLGGTRVWREGNKDCRILFKGKGDVRKDSADWKDIFDWFRATAIKSKGEMAKFEI